jgi:Ion channel
MRLTRKSSANGDRMGISWRPGYGLVLLAIVLAVSIISFAPDTATTRFLALVVLGAALLLALRTSRVSSQVERRAAMLVGLAVIAALGALVTGRGTPEFTAGLTLILVGLTPIVLATRLVRNPEVTTESLLGAACVYLLIGLFFALIFGLTPALTGAPFFNSTEQATASDYVYFSYITITTVGYGDLTPHTALDRMLAVADALVGQLYLVTVVALLVSQYRPRASSAGK